MTTTDTPFAAFLIERGYELLNPVDYSQPKWVYEFDMDDEEHVHLLDTYRRGGYSAVHKIACVLVAVGHGKPLQPWVEEKWPTLVFANRQGEGVA
jgi:hypothetical protein